MSRLRTYAGLVWIALRQLRSDRMRTVLAVIGVTLAVLSVTLLTGVGAGVISTGNQMFDDSGERFVGVWWTDRSCTRFCRWIPEPDSKLPAAGTEY